MRRKASKIIAFVLTLAVIGGSPIIPAAGGLAIVAEAHCGQSGHHGAARHHSTSLRGKTANTPSESTTGWHHDGCGWQNVDDSWRYFDENGCMLSDTCSYIDGSYCHFDEHGDWDGCFYDGTEEHRQSCAYRH